MHAYRWMDLNFLGAEKGDSAEFLGGTGEADIWLTRRNRVLICQYREDDNYVSYCPPSALYNEVMELGMDDHADYPIDDLPEDARVVWHGASAVLDIHRPREIANYLALFCPDLFTSAERMDLLAHALTDGDKSE